MLGWGFVDIFCRDLPSKTETELLEIGKNYWKLKEQRKALIRQKRAERAAKAKAEAEAKAKKEGDEKKSEGEGGTREEPGSAVEPKTPATAVMFAGSSLR